MLSCKLCHTNESVLVRVAGPRAEHLVVLNTSTKPLAGVVVAPRVCQVEHKPHLCGLQGVPLST